MKIIHTGDWHLGAKLGVKSRLEEQKGFLEWLCRLLAAESPRADLLVVAGDVFDSGAPSNEALAEYYRFLRRVDREELVRQVIIIGGNHDSPAFLGAPKPVLEGVRTSVVADGADSLDAIAETEAFAIGCADGGTLAVAAVPYLRPSQLVNAARDAGVSADLAGPARLEAGFRAHCEAAARAARLKAPAGSPLVLVAHGSFAGAVPSDDVSEVARRMIGGLGEISLDALPRADYVALGHYHRRQSVGGRDAVRYAGAPIPMSFAESDQGKGVLVVEFRDGAGPVVREEDYPDAQPFWRFRGTTDEIAKTLGTRLEAEPDSTAWIEAVMDDPSGDRVRFRRTMLELVKNRAVTLMIVRAEREVSAGGGALTRAAGEDLHSYTPLMLAKRRFESMGLEPDASREYLAMLEEVFEPGVHAAGESGGAK